MNLHILFERNKNAQLSGNKRRNKTNKQKAQNGARTSSSLGLCLCPGVLVVERAKLCQRKIAAQFIAKVHYSANVASLCWDEGEWESGRRRRLGNAFKSSLSFELFNYKVRKMLAYFSAVCDTDEEQVMQPPSAVALQVLFFIYLLHE